jgi:hypothetical protein
MSGPVLDPAATKPPMLPRPGRGPLWTRRALWLLLGICVLAAMVRLYHIERWAWSAAEADTWRLVTAPMGGPTGFFANAESRFPVAYLGLRWLLTLGVLPAENELWLRLPFAFVGTITVPLLALLTAQIATVRTAIGAALLLALHPWHVAASQSAEPAVVVTFAALIVYGLVLQRRWWLAGIAQVVAGLCHPFGWLALPAAIVLRRLPNPLLGRLGFALWCVAIIAWLPHLDLLRPAMLLLAAVMLAQPHGMVTATSLAVAVPAAAAAVATFAGAPAVAAGGLLALPPLCVLAAGGAAHAARAWRDASQKRPLRVALAGLGLAIAAVDAGIATFLQTTLHAGQRPPWRDARSLVIVAAGSGRAIAVGTGAGYLPLTCYLRPNHWREVGDPHPGMRVAAVAPDASSLAAFVASLDGEPANALLILRADEEEALRADAAATALLHREFELWQVLPGPREGRDDTLFVHRRVPLR